MSKTTKISQAENIRRYIKKYPGKSISAVAKELGLRYQAVHTVKRNMEQQAAPKWVVTQVDTPAPAVTEEPKADPVNHPAHYKVGGIETIDYIKAKLSREEYRGYLKGNILKYGSRVGHKGDAAIDAGKIGWYAKELEALEKEMAAQK